MPESSGGFKSPKKFLLLPSQIKPIAPNYGGCFASDHITVEGRKVGYMYREEPMNDQDSGWRFLSGQETQEYIDDSSNLETYEVNTIANYDPDIIPFLQESIGSAFVRDKKGRLARAKS